MKTRTLQYFFFMALATVLMAADCSNKDSEFYNDVFATSPNLVVIETSDVPEDQSVFVVADIDRLLSVTGLSKPLDIYKTTGGAAKLNFSYEIEKQNGDDWDYIEIASNQILTSIGNSETGSFVLAKSVYNEITQTYEYRAVIQNLASGNYRLSFGYNSDESNIVELRSESANNNLFLNLNSPNTLNLDANGYFYFTVN
ncbi:hypothetical protein G4D82_06315 [Flavobacterium sp. CYK-4]|uniref:hypothetical protein n=1 Tax=Flavobacterium lotistagni TaxID=2709660 RepID=UPI0014074F94|nr:hypothetical protein [Flavobacterium lotistagni]NHM06827.1 hypothetical protein [Flavobacterium lotistagni]